MRVFFALLINLLMLAYLVDMRTSSMCRLWSATSPSPMTKTKNGYAWKISSCSLSTLPGSMTQTRLSHVQNAKYSQQYCTFFTMPWLVWLRFSISKKVV
jgi:hypothetical protein